MEGEIFNAIRKQENAALADASHEGNPLPELLFIPSELLKKDLLAGSSKKVSLKEFHLFHNPREVCAAASIVFGVTSLISWIVILFGLLSSISGVILSLVGLKSDGSKYARIGLGLSIVGLVASLLYAFAAYQGMINYNYFTTEFWG